MFQKTWNAHQILKTLLTYTQWDLTDGFKNVDHLKAKCEILNISHFFGTYYSKKFKDIGIYWYYERYWINLKNL